MEHNLEIPAHTVIYTKPSDHLLFLLGGLGAFIYVIFFLNKTEYEMSFVFLAISVFLIIKYLQNTASKPKLILSEAGIQLVGQPFVSWAMVHGLQIRPEIKGDVYTETFVFTNNGRIQEISLSTLTITSWQLEKLLEVYQQRFREVLNPTITVQEQD